MKAMILAAGLGTRLFPLTIDRTKPAIPFLGRPLVRYVAEYLASHGIREVVVNLHHQPESVRTALGDGSDFGIKITYIEEIPDILGTSGALDNARHLLEDGPFVVVNGKIVTDINLAAAIESHRHSGACATMVLKENTLRERFTEVITEGDRLRGFGAMPSPDESTSRPPLMFTGIQILDPSVFEYIPRGVYSDIVPSFYKPALEEGRSINAHVSRGNWYELSTTLRYLEISLAMSKDSDVILGSGASVQEGARVSHSILWENAVVSNGARLDRVVVGAGAVIPGDAQLQNVVVVRSELLNGIEEEPEKAARGHHSGGNYIVPLT